MLVNLWDSSSTGNDEKTYNGAGLVRVRFRVRVKVRVRVSGVRVTAGVRVRFHGLDLDRLFTVRI